MIDVPGALLVGAVGAGIGKAMDVSPMTGFLVGAVAGVLLKTQLAGNSEVQSIIWPAAGAALGYVYEGGMMGLAVGAAVGLGLGYMAMNPKSSSS